MLGNLELLEARLREEQLIRLVQAASRSAWRGAQLTQQMLAFSRKQVLAAKPTDLNAAVSGMSEMLRRTLGEHGVEVGRGTGLGLSQVYGLARQSGGTARIRSRLGEGTTAEIYLPRATAPSTDASTQAEAAQPVAQHWTVLLVDDQDEVRNVIAQHLDVLGYRCVEASNGPSRSTCCAAAASTF